MNNALRSALSIECLQLVDQVEILQQDRSILAGGQGVLVIRHRSACIGGESFRLLTVNETSREKER
jgi:hypothetical protein